MSLNYQVDVLSIRHGDTWENVNYPAGAKTYLINDKEVWGCPRLRELLAMLKRGDVIGGIKLLRNRIAYKKQMASDYKACQKKIAELAPDVIINSHYEVLDGINENYLKKTIMHFHTSFDQVLVNSSYLKTFKKYTSKICCFVWLSEKTRQEAVAHGLKNSKCIYNPLSFSEKRCADMSNKKMIFIGRLSEEKRVHLAIEYFKEVIHENGLEDWIFEIYGDGVLADRIAADIKRDSQVIYKGRTDKVNEVLLESSLLVLTSCFEGMPLVVLEANECGVPALIFDFGESSKEVVIDGKTGVIVPKDDKDVFKASMKKLFENEEYRRKLSVGAKEYAETFSIERIGQQWLDLFREMEN